VVVAVAVVVVVAVAVVVVVVVVVVMVVVLVVGSVSQMSPRYPSTHSHTQSPVVPLALPPFRQGAQSGPAVQVLAISQSMPSYPALHAQW